MKIPYIATIAGVAGWTLACSANTPNFRIVQNYAEGKGQSALYMENGQKIDSRIITTSVPDEYPIDQGHSGLKNIVSGAAVNSSNGKKSLTSVRRNRNFPDHYFVIRYTDGQINSGQGIDGSIDAVEYGTFETGELPDLFQPGEVKGLKVVSLEETHQRQTSQGDFENDLARLVNQIQK